jgi:hypothetical protein
MIDEKNRITNPKIRDSFQISRLILSEKKYITEIMKNVG